MGNQIQPEPNRGRYQKTDRERFVPERPKSPGRNDFERDRARILHASALRRLGAKTQVLGPSDGDFIRTRLTHTLEVAQVGRELGKGLGCDPDVVDTACLSHDLGHPPFGHNGEQALAEVTANAGGFEGNAQTLRLLTRLEPKVLDQAGRPAGLNLTRASLDATCKYPWGRFAGPGGEKSPKFGFYEDDRAVFEWARQGAPSGRKCIEAQIMDLADDIGYSVHDVEDAFQLRRAVPWCLNDPKEREEVIASTCSWYSGTYPQDLDEAAQRLVKLPFWMGNFDGSYRDLARLKDLTSQLIGRFSKAALEATQEKYGSEPLSRYDADLVVPEETRVEITLLKGIAVHYVMVPRELQPVYLEQRTVIFDLVEAMMERGAQVLSEPFATAWNEAGGGGGGEPARLRAVVDQVACLTDTSAYRMHASLRGMLSRTM